MGLATERLRLEGLGLSQEEITIQGERAAPAVHTLLCFSSGACPLPCVLIFLQLLLDRRLAFRTVKTCAAAISPCHEGFDDRKGVCRHRPVARPTAWQWYLALVLRALSKTPFKPLEFSPSAFGTDSCQVSQRSGFPLCGSLMS